MGLKGLRCRFLSRQRLPCLKRMSGLVRNCYASMRMATGSIFCRISLSVRILCAKILASVYPQIECCWLIGSHKILHMEASRDPILENGTHAIQIVIAFSELDQQAFSQHEKTLHHTVCIQDGWCCLQKCNVIVSLSLNPKQLYFAFQSAYMQLPDPVFLKYWVGVP